MSTPTTSASSKRLRAVNITHVLNAGRNSFPHIYNNYRLAYRRGKDIIHAEIFPRLPSPATAGGITALQLSLAPMTSAST